MANENNAVNEFIDALKAENGNDKLLENMLPQAKEQNQQPEEGQEKEEPEKVGFHKDPKVQRYIEKMVSKRVSEAVTQMPKQEQERIQDNPDELRDLVDSFTKIVGNDKPENAELVKRFGETMQSFRDRSLQAQEVVEARNQEVQQEKEAEEELNTGFEEIDEEFGVDLWEEKNRKLKGQFLDYVEDIAHKDRNGEIDEFPDIVGAYKSFVKTSKRENPTLMAKDLADRSGTKSSSGAGDSKPQERITFDNIGDKIDRMFS